jgi:hypothetical protein
MSKRIVATLAVVAILAVMFVSIALAAPAAPDPAALHLKLDKSEPAAEQVLEASPEKIVLYFSQRPELAISRVTITGAEGEAKVGKVQRNEENETILWAAVEEPLADGAYTVAWVTSSADLHPVRGEFTFTVRAAR